MATFEELKDRGNKCFKAQDYKAALQWYDQCIEVNDKNPIAYSNKAMCLIKLERYSEAEKACQKGLILLKTSQDSDKIKQKLLYRLQQAQQHQGTQDMWREVAIHSVDELPPELASL